MPAETKAKARAKKSQPGRGGKPELRVKFTAWLIDPMREGTQQDWAREHGVEPATLSDWKRTPEVREAMAAWRDSYKPAFVEVVSAMFRKGTRGDVQAARLVGDWLGEDAPKKLEHLGLFEWLAKGANGES